jgi:predicted DNA-binding transcriptional regulator AlpA
MALPVTTRRVRVADTTTIESVPSMTMSLAQAAGILGIHRTTAWSLHKRGEFPVPVLQLGSSLRVVRAHLEQYMSTGIPVEPGTRIDALSATK